MFAPIYECPKCGDVWEVSIHEDIDTQSDEVYPVAICSKCNSRVLREKKDEEGCPIVHALAPDEIQNEILYNNFIDEDDGLNF